MHIPFDKVVLGISIGAFKDWKDPTTGQSSKGICMELYNDKKNQRFHDMVDAQAVTKSMSCQLWLKPTLPDLGWKVDKSKGHTGYMFENPPYSSNYLVPEHHQYDCWIDFSFMLPYENWQKEKTPPKTLIYFTHVDDIGPKQTYESVAQDYLDNYVWFYWPDACPNNKFNYDLLWAPDNLKGVDRLKYQHFSPIYNRSDWYVQSPAKSTPKRLWANESGYTNLVLSGDWAQNRQNIGGVEAACLAGVLASNAVGGISNLYEGAIETTKKKPW